MNPCGWWIHPPWGCSPHTICAGSSSCSEAQGDPGEPHRAVARRGRRLLLWDGSWPWLSNGMQVYLLLASGEALQSPTGQTLLGACHEQAGRVKACCVSERQLQPSLLFHIFYPFWVSYFLLVTNKGLNVRTTSSCVTLRKMKRLSPEAQHLGIFEVTYFSSLCQSLFQEIIKFHTQMSFQWRTFPETQKPSYQNLW